MPIESRWSVPVPEVSLPTWLFGSSPSGPLPDRRSFIDTNDPDHRYLTFSDFRLWAKRVGLGLRTAGLRPGDKVLVFSGNNLFYLPVMISVIIAGGVFTGASPSFTSRELKHQLVDSGAALMLAGNAILDVALEAAAQAGMSKEHVYAFDSTPAGLNRAKQAKVAESEHFSWSEPSDPRTATSCLNYSSGSTGVPKGVEITHRAYVAHSEAFYWHRHRDPKFDETRDPGSVLCFTPLYHAMGQANFVFVHPKLGMSVYIMAVYKFENMLKHIQHFGITNFMCVPAIPLSMTKSPLTVREIVCGTAPLAPEVARATEKLFPSGRVLARQGWGMTELTCTGMVWDPTVAQPDESLHSAATREAIVEEGGKLWLRTGGIAYVDKYAPGGKVRLVDRAKELIKAKGFQVAPAELEAVILERNNVADAGVVGVVINEQEVPRAYVVKVGGANITGRDIAQWVEGRLARYKWLKGGVVFIDSIPRLQSGKILRRVLRSRAEQEVGDKVQKLLAAKLA
ncbi:AMP-binding enzyme [Thelonectria olida]|uniref:AMP-binding enzyme n=1 Tax=Thelonectria olida TaxID=1576542 RepID=A0A9P9AKD6_9HYPO|nr:AMP-binding enzyme [Thelonectria olida]